MNDDPIEIAFPPGHYYSPIPDTHRLAAEPARSRVWPSAPRPTPGIDWLDGAQVELCGEFARQEPLRFAEKPTGDEREYFMANGMYPPLDAWILQAVLRHFRPARMIEVGAGYSSLVTARVNRELLGAALRVTCIDPHPQPFLAAGVDGISEIRAEEIQDTPLELFRELRSGDVLFVDSSHTVKTGGDVPWLYNQVIPQLASGVLVHIHDAFLPGDYPSGWVLKGTHWNELYLLQAFLAFNSAFEIVFGAQWMMSRHREELLDAFPGVDFAVHLNRLACSLWIRRL